MNENQKEQQDGEMPSWLEKLQQESWQTEILISGGASIGIIGLLNNLGPLESFFRYSTKLHPLLTGLPILIAFSFLFFLAEGFFSQKLISLLTSKGLSKTCIRK